LGLWLINSQLQDRKKYRVRLGQLEEITPTIKELGTYYFAAGVRPARVIQLSNLALIGPL